MTVRRKILIFIFIFSYIYVYIINGTDVLLSYSNNDGSLRNL